MSSSSEGINKRFIILLLLKALISHDARREHFYERRRYWQGMKTQLQKLALEQKQQVRANCFHFTESLGSKGIKTAKSSLGSLTSKDVQELQCPTLC